jgi:hypothetical protein
VVLVSSVALVRAADITGKWTGKFMSQVGEQEYTYDFVVKGATLTGTAKGNLVGESPIAEGKVDGDKITFVENAKYMDMPLRIEYTGMVMNDEIKLSRKVGDFPPEEFVAKRTK